MVWSLHLPRTEPQMKNRLAGRLVGSMHSSETSHGVRLNAIRMLLGAVIILLGKRRVADDTANWDDR
jgi:hypothetical protein